MKTINKLTISLLVTILDLAAKPYCIGQAFPNRDRYGVELFNNGAVYAAAYFLYADYLNNPDDIKDLALTAYLLTELEEYKVAEPLLNRIDDLEDVESFSDSLRLYYYSSRAQVDYNNNNYMAALRSLNKIPLNEHLTEIKALSCEELGLFERAINLYESMSSQSNQYRKNCLIASCYRQMGKYTEAIDYYSRALRLYPDSAFPYYGIGWSYELSGDDNNALKFYENGLSVDQSYPYLFLMRGELYLKNGFTEKAKDDFTQVLKKDKVLEDGTCRQYALFFLGRNEDAMNWMNRLIEIHPNDPGNYYDKACLCSRMGLLNEAIEAVDLMFQKGYRKFAHLDADDDIDPIKNMPEYIELYNKYHAIYMDELEQLKDIL